MIDYLALIALVRPQVRLLATGWALLASHGAYDVLKLASGACHARVGVVRGLIFAGWTRRTGC